jgi:hypothetical protein
MDLDQAGELIKRREYGGLLYAHTYGDESTPVEFFEVAKSLDPDLILVDDRCLCIPGFEPSSPADVILYSTGHAKIVELEFGGYAFLGSDIPYQPATLPFRPVDLAQLEEQYKSTVKEHRRFNYRESDWLMAEFDLPAWDEYRRQIEAGLKGSLTHRRQLNDIYTARLPAHIQLPENYQTWRFSIRVKDRQKILDAVFRNELFASSHYASLAGIMSEGRAPAAEALAEEVINLFNDHNFTAGMAERACDTILKAL